MCEDINECLNKNTCEEGFQCENKVGSHECLLIEGKSACITRYTLGWHWVAG